MNIMDIQREAIVEIVGTQYEGRPINHRNLSPQQSLAMAHQSENIHDNNAVVILTEDGKQLGVMPKGYASLYAPAIDSGRYSFAVNIVRTEPDPDRPILIVKITSELKNQSEKDTEKDVLAFVQSIVNGYAQETTEYLKFIYAESVNAEALFSALNRVRMLQRLHSCSKDIIQSLGIVQTSENYPPTTKESLKEHLKELKDYVNDALKRIQKAYNESLDIDDEEEYHRVQSDIRERRKKFRSFDTLLSSYQEVVEKYVYVETPSTNDIEEEVVHPGIASEGSVLESQAQAVKENNPDLSEQAFFAWLISKGCVSESTAGQYISNIHSIEKLYQTLLGARVNLLGINSTDKAKAMIESLIARNEYIDANERRHNSFGAALAKFIQFADISVEGFQPTMAKRNYQEPVSSAPFIFKTVDFDNPYDCTYYKPCSFMLNNSKYEIGSWKELYTKFLRQLYADNTYSEILRGLVGKSIYGHKIDFADRSALHNLRKPINVSTDFFAEGNLSAVDIIKRIESLMKLCSIAKDSLVIEYQAQENANEQLGSANTSIDEHIQLSVSDVPEESIASKEVEQSVDEDKRIEKNGFVEWLINHTDSVPAAANSYYLSVKTSEDIARKQGLKSQRLFDAYSYEEASETFRELLQCDAFVQMNTAAQNRLAEGIKRLLLYYYYATKQQQQKVEQTSKEVPNIEKKPVIASFKPNTEKPFELKDAVIEILSSEAPEIAKHRVYKNGISSKLLRELLKKYYGKTIGLFEMSALLMTDKTFKSVGKGCYILNGAMTRPKAVAEYSEPTITELPKDEPNDKVFAERTVHTDHNVVSFTEKAGDTPDADSKHDVSIEEIIEVFKENSGNLQYEDGFGAYEVKTLLLRKGIEDVSEERIEYLMSESSELRQIEDGYYSLINENSSDDSVPEKVVAVEDMPDIANEVTVNDAHTQEIPQEDAEKGLILLGLNGNIVRAYDYPDALFKICEFSINCKPFRMARIAGCGILLNGKNAFCRQAAPVDGYHNLSNGLQVAPINTVSDLQTITDEIKKYCQIDDTMISIIS